MLEKYKNNKNPKINKKILTNFKPILYCLRVAFRPRLLNSNQETSNMTQELYAIHDNKASFFMTPWPLAATSA